jgi:hypothetical protein
VNYSKINAKKRINIAAMKQNLTKKPCPTCKTSIGTGFFSKREEIIRSPNCKELLIDNPKRRQIGVFIILIGIVLWLGCSYWLGLSVNWGFLIILVSLVISFIISNLSVVKRDLVIRNKQTNEITYINKSDWNEILMNTSNKENLFEIVEELK